MTTHPIPPVDSQAALEALDKLRKLKFESKWAVAIKDKQDAILRAFIQSRAAPVSPSVGDGITTLDEIMRKFATLERALGPNEEMGRVMVGQTEAVREMRPLLDSLRAMLAASPRPAEGWRPIDKLGHLLTKAFMTCTSEPGDGDKPRQRYITIKFEHLADAQDCHGALCDLARFALSAGGVSAAATQPAQHNGTTPPSVNSDNQAGVE
jgi:hypothetical protein